MFRHQYVQLEYRVLVEPFYLHLDRHLGLVLELRRDYAELVSLGSIRTWWLAQQLALLAPIEDEMFIS